MIATCGHKVFEGISCSLKLSEKEWSYGTYCADCLKSYFDNNEIDNESEVVKLLQELAKLKTELKDAIEVIEFYLSKDLSDCIFKSDEDRHRRFLAKYRGGNVK